MNLYLQTAFGIIIGVGLLIWALIDILLIIGASKNNKLAIKIWIVSNFVLIGTVFAVFGIWQMTICMIFFLMAFLSGIKMIKKIEEGINESSDMISLNKNVESQS